MSSRNLVVRAGGRAAQRLRSEGFDPEIFDTLVGASGGPKWLVLRHLDAVLIERIIEPRTRPLDLLGSSIGSFRHACFAQQDPRSALARFTESYVGQSYVGRPGMEEISRESDRILAHFLGPSGAAEIATNRTIQSHVIATRLRREGGSDRGWTFRRKLVRAAASNLISRRLLERSFSRMHFSSAEASFGPTAESPAIGFDDFDTRELPLSKENIPHALLASGSIPLVMAGVRSVPGIPEMLFDGGIIDYHFDFRFRRRPGLVLFPHFFDRITPGWFDKGLRWRTPRVEDLEDVVLIAPSPAFVAKLPGGRVPDRNDFLELATADRIRRWKAVMDRSRTLADEFQDLLEGRGLSDAIERFPT